MVSVIPVCSDFWILGYSQHVFTVYKTWCLHFKYIIHFLFEDEHRLKDLRQHVSDRAGYSLDVFTFSFCSDSNLGEKKKKSCLYFSITFNWPVENAGVSLKTYKQIHHYVSH